MIAAKDSQDRLTPCPKPAWIVKKANYAPIIALATYCIHQNFHEILTT